MANESQQLTGSVTVSLHPLVIMNVSDHFTRCRVQESGGSVAGTKVYGALLGVQKGRSVEISNSFELLLEEEENGRTKKLNKAYFTAKEEQFKQVFPNIGFVGWYTTGDAPTPDDSFFHEQLCQDRENSLLLKLNPMARSSQLPVTLYESLIEISGGQTCVNFSWVPYTLATEEAERVGVDHIARVSVSGSQYTSAVADQLGTTLGSVKMLHARVRLILDYLKSVQCGEILPNSAILREIYCLTCQLPVLDNLSFEKSFMEQTSDVLLIAHLAALTKGLGTASEFVSKMNAIHDRHGMSRRTRGLLF